MGKSETHDDHEMRDKTGPVSGTRISWPFADFRLPLGCRANNFTTNQRCIRSAPFHFQLRFCIARGTVATSTCRRFWHPNVVAFDVRGCDFNG